MFDVNVLNGADLFAYNGINTFNDYANSVFIPYIKKQLESSLRVDVVWHTYNLSSIKESRREKRGKEK